MRALLLYPKFPPSYWTFDAAVALAGRRGFLPPLGLITVAAILPQDWDFRLVDCNVRPVRDEDWDWADIVMLSGMIVQQQPMMDLIREGKRRRKPVAVGGPYVTSVPEDAKGAGADFLVLDEGEITIPPFVQALARGVTSGTFRSNGQMPDMTVSPVPRYDLVDLDDYMVMSVQFSRGCPFLCEFCDIVALYGRRPRTKTSDQILTELQTLYGLGWRHNVFMVDDNFIGNKRAVKPLLRAMAEWQAGNGYPFLMTTEASINLADDAELLDLMQDAHFGVVFIGVETPDMESLRLTRKGQNLRGSMVEKIRFINRSGLRVMAGFIIGFDGEQPGADRRIIDFTEQTAIPHVFFNMLQALPKTQLADRLRREGRLFGLNEHAGINNTCLTNFLPTRPLRELVQEYLNATWYLYEPENYLRRSYQHCLMLQRKPKQGVRPARRARRDVIAGLILLWRHGVVRRTRWQFWSHFIGLWRQNRGALNSFMGCCFHYEHFFRFREEVRNRINAQQASLRAEDLERVYQPPAPAPTVASDPLKAAANF